MLSTVPYSELSGQRNIEWDAILLCANFMKMWALVPQVVKDMCGHHETQEKLPDDKIEKLIASRFSMLWGGIRVPPSYGYHLWTPQCLVHTMLKTSKFQLVIFDAFLVVMSS